MQDRNIQDNGLDSSHQKSSTSGPGTTDVGHHAIRNWTALADLFAVLLTPREISPGREFTSTREVLIVWVRYLWIHLCSSAISGGSASLTRSLFWLGSWDGEADSCFDHGGLGRRAILNFRETTREGGLVETVVISESDTYLNMRSLNTSFEEMCSLVADFGFDVFGVTES
ncbi:hypothetical protein J6590_026815 [Homalodisca vitripennis]|nr:hypothetical protein J6590_026815 [Homalodisca vitripennis]